MIYELRLAGPARRYLDRLDLKTQDRFERKFQQIAADPFDLQHSKPLSGAGSRRSARVGGWRIIFTVYRESQVVLVDEIGPRGQIYRRL